MINEAALLAARKNKKTVTMNDVEEAMVKVMMGPEKKSKVISEKERKLTAYHEAGHAVVSRFYQHMIPYIKYQSYHVEWPEDIQCINQMRIRVIVLNQK